jgi:hypothetical protein
MSFLVACYHDTSNHSHDAICSLTLENLGVNLLLVHSNARLSRSFAPPMLAKQPIVFETHALVVRRLQIRVRRGQKPWAIIGGHFTGRKINQGRDPAYGESFH